MKIEIPRPTVEALTSVRGIWHALYYRDGVAYRRSLSTRNKKDALKFRDQFYSDLVDEHGATVKKRTAAQKLADKPSLYVYYRKPWVVQIKGKLVAECETQEEALAIRDRALEARR